MKRGRSLGSRLLAGTILVTLAALPRPAWAQLIWDGSVSADWFDAQNWNLNRQPAPTDPVVIDTTVPNATSLSTGSASILDLIVGAANAGSGNLTIRNGGTLASGGVVIGGVAGSTGYVRLVDENSLWTVTGPSFVVGDAGTGTLNLWNLSHLDFAGGVIDVARQAGSTGTIIFGPDPAFVPPPGQGLNVRAGTLEAAAIRFGAGHGTLLFNGSATGGTVLAPVLIGNGQLVLPENRLILNTNSPDFTGHAAIGLGHLVVNGFLPNMTVGVNQTPPAPASFGGGILSGVGTVGSTVLHPGGDLAPGDPDRRGTAAGVGTLTVNGSLTFNPSANPQFGYFADIAPTAADRVVVAGTASIVGELFVFGTGGDYVAGQQYTLLSAGSPLAGQFRTFSVSGDFGGLRASLSYDANNAYLDLTDYASGTDARWLANAGSGNWHTPGHWDPAAVPNGTATFGASTRTTIDFSSGMTGIQSIVFEPGAPVYTFNISNVVPGGGATGSDYIDILGAGVVNNSSSRPIFFVSPQTGNAVHFRNASSADDAILNAGVYFEGGYPYTFHDESTAADATIATLGGFSTAFRDDSTAANARFEAGALELGSSIGFFDRSSAGTATFDTGPTGGVVFSDRSTAAAAEIVSRSSNASLIDPDATANVFAGVAFRELSTAGTATISNVEGGTTEFRDTASAASATIINSGTPWYQRTLAFWDTSTAADATITNDSDGSTQFFGNSSAANATIVNNEGGETFFSERATAATATIVNNAGGRVQISALTGPSITIGTLSGAGDIYLGDSNLRLAGLGGDATIGGVIADGGVLGPNSEFPSGEVGGSLTWAGAATLTLTGSNTYTGGTTLAGGTLRIGHSNALGTGALTTTGSVVDYADGVTVANPIVLNSNDTRLQVTAGTATQAGVISQTGGARPLRKIGDGTLILSADNTYTGTTTISAGTLQLGNGGGTGAILGNIVNNAALVVDRTGTLTLGGVISGSGTLEKRGTGTLILDGSNTYIGLTRPRAGTLLVNGTIGEVFTDSGTTLGTILGGTGTVGRVNADNLFIAPGSGGIGTLTSASRVDFRGGGGMFSEVAPNSADRLDIAQTAFINGTLHLVATGGNYAAGTQYTLLNATGGIVANSSGNGLVFDNVSMQGSFDGLAPTISYSDNSVILTLVADGRTEWRGTQSTDWFTPANWLDNLVPTSTTPTYINTVTPNPTVISGGTAASGELFIGSNPTETGNLTIQNGGILATTGAAHLGLGNFTNVLEPGVGAVLVSGAGSAWIVSGALNLGGNTAANENVGVGTGRLRIEDGASVTSNGATVFSTEIGFGGADSTVLVTGTGSVWNTGDLGVSTTGGFTTDRLTIENGGTVNSLSTTASGRLLVTGAGSVWYSGPLTLGGGNMRVENGGRVDTAGDGVLAGTFFNNSAVVTGAGSVWDITGSLRISQSGLFEAGIVTLADGGTVNVGGGAGTVFLGAANTLPILNIGASAAPGTLNAAEVVTAGQGSVIFNHTSSDYVFAPRISGDSAIGGSAVFVGGGTTIFTADHTYTGGTSIDGGRLQLGNGGSTGSIVGDIAINGAGSALVISRDNDLTLAGVISGADGLLDHRGLGTLSLTGNSSFTGATTVNLGGTLVVDGSLAGRVSVSFGTLSGNGTVGSLSLASGGSAVAPGTGIGTLTVSGDAVFNNGTLIAEVAPDAADHLIVGGDASLGDRLTVIATGGTYTPGQYVLLTAGGASGSFGPLPAVEGDFSGLAASLSYTGTQVLLNLAPSVDSEWRLDPGSRGFWTATNWTTDTVPTGVANFNATNQPNVEFVNPVGSPVATLQSFRFGTDAPAYFFTMTSDQVTFVGPGIVNNSAFAPTFNVGNRSNLEFRNASTAANAIINVSGGTGRLEFFDTSTAGNATVRLGNPPFVIPGFPPIPDAGLADFFDNSTAGSATIDNVGGQLNFHDDSTAGNATITNQAGIIFLGSSSAGTATITNNAGGVTIHTNATADTARIVNNAGAVVDVSSAGGAASVGIGSLSGAGNVFLGARNLTLGNLNLDATISGVIADGGTIAGTGGSLTKVGTETLTLTGENTYTGGTTINGGELTIGDGGSTGSIVGDIAIGASATLNINRTGTVTLAGEISGTGGISQFNNALTTILTGNSPNFTGGIALGRGTLLANGSIPGARVVVGANGILSGTGTVGATEVFGFIAPGAAESASVGTLTVQTSLRLERTYIVDVTPVTADLVTVNGTATLGGQLFATDLGGTYFNGQQFIVLTASSGIAGAFDTFSTNPGTFGGLQTALSYTNNSVILNVGTSTPGGPAVWDGSQSTDWFTAANWISNAVPTVADEVTINTATPNRTVIDRMGAASADILIGTAAGATGNLAIDGTLSSDGDARVGANGGSGTVLVSGSGSNWLISGELALALQGGTSAGSVTVRDGASLVNSGTTVGGIAGGPAGPTGVGTIVVTGGGTTWNSGAVLIGSRGLLTISDGAAVTSSGVSIHNDTAVTGPGTVWTTGDLSVLDGIDGALTIADGAVVNSGDVGLGPAPDLGGGGASQVVTVTGVGTTWNIAGDLRIGNPLQQAMSNDIAYFHLVDNAIVDVGGGTGTVYVGVGGSLPDLLILGDALSQNRPGTLNAARVEVGAGSSINFRSVAGTPYVFAPAIGGEGDIVAFSGTTVLTADSGLFSGTTTIDSGATLQLGNGASTGALGGTIALGDDSTLAVNRTGTLALGGVISGTGGFAQRGSVVTRMTATNTYTGGTVVNGGTLLVDGSIAGSAVSVNDTGVLGGAGAVGATTIATGGTLAPGNSIGTLNIVGNLSFAAGSFFQVEANAAGQADRIALTGAATISGGTVNVLAAAGNYAPSTVYTILSAIGGVTGTFSDVTSNLAFLTPELGYGANTVTLTLTRNAVSFCSVGDTFNQCSTGGAIELLGTGNAVFDGVVRLDAATARDAFDQLSGEAHATLAGVLVEDGRFVRDAATNRVRAAFGDHPDEMPLMAYDGPGALPGSDADRSAAWVHTFGSWRDRGGDGNASALERSTGGVLFGVDGAVAEDLRLGVLGGFANSSFNVPARTSAGRVESWHIGIYGGGRVGAIGLSAGAAYSWHGIETTRLVAFPAFADWVAADYRASTLQVFGEASYTFDIGDATIEPFAGLAHVRFSTDGFTETGGAGALTMAAYRPDVTFSTIGLRGDFRLPLQGIDARATGMVGWRHAFGDVVPTASPAFAGGGTFPVLGLPIARDTAVVETGLALDFSPRSTLGISYSGQFGSGAFEHGARASFSLRF